MGVPEEAADASALGMVNVKVEAEFWIDLLDHVSLKERRGMLLSGRQTESPGSFPMCGVDSALKQVNQRVLLEVFMSKLACALRPISAHGNQKQIVTESSPMYDLGNGQSSGGQIYYDTFAGGRFGEIQNDAVAINFVPVQMTSHMAVNIGDRHPLEDCIAEGSWSNICQNSCLAACPGDGDSFRGQTHTGAACSGTILSSRDDTMKVNVQPSEASVVPHENKINVSVESEKDHLNCTSQSEGHKVSLFSSIDGGCSQLDASLESDRCYLPLTESIIPSTHGRSSVCYPEEAYREDLSSHSQDLSGHVSRHSGSDVKDHNAAKLTGHDIVGKVLLLGESVNGSSVRNAAEHICTSMNDISASSIVSFSCVSEECFVIKSDRVSGAGTTADIAGLKEQSSSNANNQFSISSSSTDSVRSKYKFGDKCNLGDESAAKHMHPSISVFPGTCAVKQVSEVLSSACMSTSVCGISSLPDKADQPPAVCQKEAQCQPLCPFNDLSLSTSTVMVKAESPYEAADAQVYEANSLIESCLLQHGSNTGDRCQAFPCQDTIHSLQENHEHGGICSQESLTNWFKVPLIEEPERNSVTEDQFCVSASSFSSHMISKDVPVAEKVKDCSIFCNHSADGAFLFSAGRGKIEPVEEIHVACSSEATTVSEFNTSTFNCSNMFIRDPPEAASSGTHNTIQGLTMCSDKMALSMHAASNLRNVFDDSVVTAFWEPVKNEVVEANFIDSVSVTETAVNFGSSAFETSSGAADMITCTGASVGCEQETHCNMNGFLQDAMLSAFPKRVRDEPLESNVIGDSEPISEKDSGFSVPNFSINAVELNPLLGMQGSSKAINCQSDSPSKICNVQIDQETTTSSSHLDIPEDTGITTRQQQTSIAALHNLDALASESIKNIEQIDEMCANVIFRTATGVLNSSCSSNNFILKAEPTEDAFGTLPSSDTPLVEAKSKIVENFTKDILDHLPLTERTRMLASSTDSGFKPARKSRCFKQTSVHTIGCTSGASIKNKAKSKTMQRKRKRTATDSVEVALEEDAPGLLQGLLDRGINLDEIKLYGCEEDIDALDISSSEDRFEDLEAVISKLFSERPTSLFKLAPLRHSKSTKAVYCLSCLISLIEQTRYLQFRNHPVEWGWCRDLQSFIFVFKMHNRIVLERPEYGYATYFFELVESFPIDWQTKRLITAMKLTSCSRATLIENKCLLVGVDLSEGEARVLEEYGWLPNTGLGSMLNYCDRVVHDRNDRDVSEWRSKIGKLLMDGYDGGRVVKVDSPKEGHGLCQQSFFGDQDRDVI